MDSRLRASALYWSSLSRADVRRWREEEEGICDVICHNLSACSGHLSESQLWYTLRSREKDR